LRGVGVVVVTVGFELVVDELLGGVVAGNVVERGCVFVVGGFVIEWVAILIIAV